MMNVDEGIVCLHGMLKSKFCQQIIKVSDKLCTERIKTKGGDTEYRKGIGHILDRRSLRDQIYFQIIHAQIKSFINHYTLKFPHSRVDNLSEIQLLKYNPGGKYDVHTDSMRGGLRHISLIMNLNENYNGGDLVFFDNKNNETKRIELKEGSVVMFPSNFLYPHKIEPITKGTRYSIVAWLT